jgi:hypothetical protein
MDTTETFFGEHPPRDGKSYDCCCARCGGSCEWQECEEWDCEDGYREEDYGDDFVSDMQVVVCDTCRGYGGWNQCGNSAKWCEENPIPGRENVKRGTLEWFRDYQEEQ